MAEVEVLLPKMGESVAEATITKWLKAVGDPIESEESLVEIATDKVDSEVPAPNDGIIVKILIEEGEVALVGQAIAIISTEEEGSIPSAVTTPTAISKTLSSTNGSNGASIQKAAPTLVSAEPIGKSTASGKFFSPLVRNIAQQEGVTVTELEAIAGSGQNGRVTKKDILAYLPNRGAQQIDAPAPVTAPVAAPIKGPTAHVAPSIDMNSFKGEVEIIEMDRMRKLIADHMVNSVHTSPHVTSYVEADVTNIVNWRNKVKDAFFAKEGEKITFTPIFMEAVVKALKDFPMVNVSVDGTNIILKKYINIGMATALPSGNLIVPVIKNADRLNLVGLTKSVNDLARRARENKLSPDDISDGTYTLTNVGSFGNVMGTPIINQPQAAILAVGSIQKKPAVIETEHGDLIGIRHKMFLSHSYDHRVVDGALGGRFVRRVADYLEQFDINRDI